MVYTLIRTDNLVLFPEDQVLIAKLWQNAVLNYGLRYLICQLPCYLKPSELFLLLVHACTWVTEGLISVTTSRQYCHFGTKRRK